MNKFDVIIPSSKADIAIVKKNIYYIKKYIPCKNIIVITSSTCFNELEGVKTIDEDLVIEGMSIEIIRKILKRRIGNDSRAGWYFQQFLKLGYCYLCLDEYYLIWDADTIPVRPFKLFDSLDRPYLTVKDLELTSTYIPSLQAILGRMRLDNKTYIAEHLLFNVEITKCLIKFIQENSNLQGEKFYEKILNSIPDNLLNESGFSEYETYARFIKKYYADLYVERNVIAIGNAKKYVPVECPDDVLKWAAKSVELLTIENYEKQGVWSRLNRFGIIRFAISLKAEKELENFVTTYKGRIRTCIKLLRNLNKG